MVKYTKACTGVSIHNGTAWECFDLLIKHIPQTFAAFPRLAALNVPMCVPQLHIHKLIPTHPT